MDRRLLRPGFALVLIALFTGLVVPQFANPRLGLAAHVVGVFGGTALIVLGIVAPTCSLSPRRQSVLRWCGCTPPTRTGSLPCSVPLRARVG